MKSLFGVADFGTDVVGASGVVVASQYLSTEVPSLTIEVLGNQVTLDVPTRGGISKCPWRALTLTGTVLASVNPKMAVITRSENNMMLGGCGGQYRERKKSRIVLV